MAYADTEQVNGSLGPHPATAGTAPTLTDLEGIIDGIAAQIDTVLQSAGVATVPVTSAVNSAFHAYLVQVNVWGAAAEHLQAAFPEATGPGENPAYAFFERRYREALAAFRKGQDIPAALLGGSNDPAPSSYFTRNPEEEEKLGDLAGAHLTGIGDRF